MSTLPKVSVIIPVYNTAPYLRECLNSVLNQTLREIEIICVDDGSTDGSPAILAEYAAMDSRVRLLRQENAGLSVARNAGTALAHGRYIYYLDSDDALHTDALARLYETSEEYRLDILFFDAEVIYQTEAFRERFQHLERYYHDLAEIPAPCTGTELLTLLKAKEMYRVSACLSFSRAAFLRENHITFYPGILHEDTSTPSPACCRRSAPSSWTRCSIAAGCGPVPS